MFYPLPRWLQEGYTTEIVLEVDESVAAIIPDFDGIPILAEQFFHRLALLSLVLDFRDIQ